MKCKNCKNTMRLLSYSPDDNTVVHICDWCNSTVVSSVSDDDTGEIIRLKRIEDYVEES